MKPTHLLVATVAILASAACNAEKGGNSAVAESTSAADATIKPPANGDWSTVVVPTSAGGFRMGDPNAKVKLVEYGSLTCPHCREFDETGVSALIEQYVKPGKVSYEFRNYVRDPYDIAASLITRCNGAASFFPLTRAIYKDQPVWVGKLQGVSQDQIQAAVGLAPDKQFLELAKLADLQQWAAMRGVPSAKSTACLSNTQEVDKLVQMNSDATSQYDIPGTPTFLINGKVAENSATWQTLKPKLDEALGG